MRLSTRARYALRLMIDLADHSDNGTPVILRDVAERQQISKRYLEQLATGLKNANLVTTSQGRGGGYMLPRAPEDITITQIIDASIGPINVVRCVQEPEICDRAETCPSRKMWKRLNTSIIEVLDSVTLADLCESGVEGAVALFDSAPTCSQPGPRGEG